MTRREKARNRAEGVIKGGITLEAVGGWTAELEEVVRRGGTARELVVVAWGCGKVLDEYWMTWTTRDLMV